jgi:cohesin complex subunit SA-1/2
MYRVSNVTIMLHSLSLTAPKTVAELQREHVFIRVMLTFLRAINTGAMHYRHGAIFLSHYSRLLEPFDQCAKTIVEILRHEGIFGGHSQTVGEVITQALREVCQLLLNSFKSTYVLIYK